MENKLQELTRKLYDEGLSKGRQEAESLLENAKAEADRIVREARAEADRIDRDAKNAAEDLRKNTLTELSLAGKQAISNLKTDIQNMIVARTTDAPIKDAMSDPEFVKSMLLAVASGWTGSSSEAISLKALLPSEMRSKLDAAFEQSVKNELNNGLEIAFSDNLKSGFRIGPQNGGYYISFTDESFDALLGEYLRPKVNELLYGGQQ